MIKLFAAISVLACAIMIAFHWGRTRNKDAAAAWFIAAFWAFSYHSIAD